MGILNFFSPILGSTLLLYSCSSASKEQTVTTLPYRYISEVESNEKSNDWTRIVNVEKLENLPIDELIDNREVEILAKDGFLVVKSLTKFDGANLIYLFDVDSMKMHGAFAPFGPGPDEFTDSRIIQSFEDDAICYVISLGTTKLYKLTRDGNLNFETKLPKPKNDEVPLKYSEPIEMITPETLLTTQHLSNGLGLCSLSLSDSLVNGIYVLDFSDDLNNWWPIYIGQMTYNKSANMTAYGSRFYDQIIFSNPSGENIKVFRGKDFDRIKTKSQAEFWETGENMQFYSDIFSDDEYVYAIFRGARGYDPEFEENGHYTIEKYTWDGSPVTQYHLPKGMMFSNGCVSKNDDGSRIVYLVNTGADDFLYRFNITD